MYGQISEDILKGFRRQLPVTGTRMEWAQQVIKTRHALKTE